MTGAELRRASVPEGKVEAGVGRVVISANVGCSSPGLLRSVWVLLSIPEPPLTRNVLKDILGRNTVLDVRLTELEGHFKGANNIS